MRNVAGAGRWELVGINEESSVRVARVNGDHSVVNVFLGTFALVAGGKETAGGVWGLAGLQAGGLGVVVVTVTVFFGDVLEDDSPVSFDVNGATDLGVVDVGWAKVTLRADPVRRIVGRWSLGSSGVVRVVEGVLLILGDVFNQVVSGLIRHVGVLLQEDWILADLVGDFVLGIFRVFDTEGKVGMEGAFWGSFGVAVSVGSRMWVVWWEGMMWGSGGPYDGNGHGQGNDQL